MSQLLVLIKPWWKMYFSRHYDWNWAKVWLQFLKRKSFSRNFNVDKLNDFLFKNHFWRTSIFILNAIFHLFLMKIISNCQNNKWKGAFGYLNLIVYYKYHIRNSWEICLKRHFRINWNFRNSISAFSFIFYFFEFKST